jgi:hypothetical protein
VVMVIARILVVMVIARILVVMVIVSECGDGYSELLW